MLKSDSAAFVYQTPAGLDAICAESGGEDASRLYEFPNGRRLILPLYRRKHLPEAFTVERSPLVGSLVAPGPPQVEELKAIFADLLARPVLRILLRPSAMTGDIWEAAAPREVRRVPHLSHVLDLQGGFDTVWKERFNSQARRAVQKAEKSHLEVARGAADALAEEFFGLYASSIERWARLRGEPPFLARWRASRKVQLQGFVRKARVLGDTCQIWMARIDGRSAAAIVVLQGANAHYTLGAMDQDLAGPTRASFLLQKLAIEAACNAGCRYYNMGETGTSETLARFKSHFGALPYTYSEFRIERVPLTAMEGRVRRFAKQAVRFGRGKSAAHS